MTREPDIVFRRYDLPFDALEALIARNSINRWQAIGPDPNNAQGRRRYRIAIWKEADNGR